MIEIKFRDIKFRRYHFDFTGKCYHVSEWGFLEGGYISPSSLSNEDKSKAIDCQFIGLHDKNGKEIYEGDIDESGSVILWNNKLSLFCTHSFYSYLKEFKPNSYPIDVSRIEIVGNMYEHKHLLTAIV